METLRDPLTQLALLQAYNLDSAMARAFHGLLHPASQPAGFVPVVYFASPIVKKTRRKKSEPRYLLVSRTHWYVCRADGGLSRCSPIGSITAIVMCQDSWLVLKVPAEHDLVFRCADPGDVSFLVNALRVLKVFHGAQRGGLATSRLELVSQGLAWDRLPQELHPNLTRKSRAPYDQTVLPLPVVSVDSTRSALNTDEMMLLKAPPPPKTPPGQGDGAHRPLVLQERDVTDAHVRVLQHPLLQKTPGKLRIDSAPSELLLRSSEPHTTANDVVEAVAAAVGEAQRGNSGAPPPAEPQRLRGAATIQAAPPSPRRSSPSPQPQEQQQGQGSAGSPAPTAAPAATESAALPSHSRVPRWTSRPLTLDVEESLSRSSTVTSSSSVRIRNITTNAANRTAPAGRGGQQDDLPPMVRPAFTECPARSEEHTGPVESGTASAEAARSRRFSSDHYFTARSRHSDPHLVSSNAGTAPTSPEHYAQVGATRRRSQKADTRHDANHPSTSNEHPSHHHYYDVATFNDFQSPPPNTSTGECRAMQNGFSLEISNLRPVPPPIDTHWQVREAALLHELKRMELLLRQAEEDGARLMRERYVKAPSDLAHAPKATPPDPVPLQHEAVPSSSPSAIGPPAHYYRAEQIELRLSKESVEHRLALRQFFMDEKRAAISALYASTSAPPVIADHPPGGSGSPSRPHPHEPTQSLRGAPLSARALGQISILQEDLVALLRFQAKDVQEQSARAENEQHHIFGTKTLSSTTPVRGALTASQREEKLTTPGPQTAPSPSTENPQVPAASAVGDGDTDALQEWFYTKYLPHLASAREKFVAMSFNANDATSHVL